MSSVSSVGVPYGGALAETIRQYKMEVIRKDRSLKN